MVPPKVVCSTLIKMNEAVPPAQRWNDPAVYHSKLGSVREDVLLVSLSNVAVSGLAWLEARHSLGVIPEGRAPGRSRLLNIY